MLDFVWDASKIAEAKIDSQGLMEEKMSGLGRLPSHQNLANSTAGYVEKNRAGLNHGVRIRVFLQRRRPVDMN